MLEWSECGKSDGFQECYLLSDLEYQIRKLMEIPHFGNRSMSDGHQANIQVFDGDYTSADLHPGLGSRIPIIKGWPFPILRNLCPCNNARWQLHFELPTVPSLWWIALKVVLCRQRRCCDKLFKKGWSHVCLQTALDFRNDLWVYVINSLCCTLVLTPLDITCRPAGCTSTFGKKPPFVRLKVGKLFPHSATQTRILRTPPWVLFFVFKFQRSLQVPQNDSCMLTVCSQVNKVDRCILEMRMEAETRLHSG